MLWLLEATGWAKRANPPAALIPLGTIAVIQAGSTVEPHVPLASPPEPKPAPAVRAPTPPPTPPAPNAVVSAAPKTTQETTPTSREPAASSSQPARVPHKKTVEVPRTPSIDPEKGLTRALKSIADEDFDQAYRLLTEVRKEKPSCPETLAALGWSAWRTGNLGTNAYDGPEDFLLLALTFDANHPKALEYALHRIEKGETENARNRPFSPQGRTRAAVRQEVLSSLSPKGKKSGMRPWPKS